VKIRSRSRKAARAKIRQINIVGTTKFAPKEILQTLELKTPNWLSWYRQDDRYSRESLQGDWRRCATSTWIAVTRTSSSIRRPGGDRSREGRHLHHREHRRGPVYKVSQIKLAGTFVVPQAELEQLLLIQPGRRPSNRS